MEPLSAQPVPTGNELDYLLHPVSVETFVSDYADRRALLIEGAGEKFAALGFDREAFFRAAERFDAGAQRLKAALPPTPGVEDEQYIPALPLQLRALFESGLTVCAAGISDNHRRLAAFAEGVRYALSVADLRFNSYLSPDGSGFNLHYDVKPIFLIQVEGRKRWWYGAEPIEPRPAVYSSSWDDKPPLAELEQTTLEPGDVLYLPAFTWHRARAEGYSLGITLGTKGVANLPVRRALESGRFFAAWPVGPLEPPLDPAQCESGDLPPAARSYLEAQLAALREDLAAITVEDLWRHWLAEIQPPKGPAREVAGSEIFSTLELRRTRRFPVFFEPGDAAGEAELRVWSAGRSVRLDRSARPLAEWLLAQEQLAVSEAINRGTRDGLARAEAKRVIRGLVDLGVFEPAER